MRRGKCVQLYVVLLYCIVRERGIYLVDILAIFEDQQIALWSPERVSGRAIYSKNQASPHETSTAQCFIEETFGDSEFQSIYYIQVQLQSRT